MVAAGRPPLTSSGMAASRPARQSTDAAAIRINFMQAYLMKATLRGGSASGRATSRNLAAIEKTMLDLD